jgi:hypothetical protein
MDSKKLIDGLQSGLNMITELAPLADKLGAGNVAILVGSVAAVAENALERIEEGALVVSERDASIVRAIASDLAAKNDALAKAIAAS